MARKTAKSALSATGEGDSWPAGSIPAFPASRNLVEVEFVALDKLTPAT
jgi:hypothetical protein